MNLLPLTLSEHFPILARWWRERAFPAPDTRLLPPTGLMVYDGEDPLCGGFLFKSDAKVGTIGHVIASPGVGGFKRSQALDALVMGLAFEARDAGMLALCAGVSAKLVPMNERYVRLGFKKADSDICTYGRDL